jgi:anaphase-promoting complex subunit 3
MDSTDCQALLSTAIKKALQALSYENAQFLAERLHAMEPTKPEYNYLLAKTHYLQGNIKFAHSLVDGISDDQFCVLLYANCCLELGLISQGESTLRSWIEKNSHIKSYELSNAYCLLGKLNRRVGRLEEARKALLSCIDIDPLNWIAFKILAEIGMF